MEHKGISIDRRRLAIKNGGLVEHNGNKFKVTNVISLSQAVGVNIENGRTKLLEVDSLKPVSESEYLDLKLSRDDSEIPDEHWAIAQERFQIIEPLIEKSSRAEIEDLADKHGIHYTTIYNWLRAYRQTKSISALVPNKRGWRPNKSRLPKAVEEVIQEGINNYYLTTQRPAISKVINYIMATCHNKGLDAPHPNSIRNRINDISTYKRMRLQGQKDQLQDKLKPAVKEFPGADYPLAYVQIDHTKLDIILVDDEYRQPIGRPWITLAIDVFSRVITGYYLSLDAPSTTSVAMCTTMSILPKNKKLIELDVDAPFDIWGIMDSIHTDNGADFRTTDLQRACLKYGISWEFRPIGGKQFGGHIERLIGSLNKEIHTLPGTTFSNTSQRGNYDSDKESAFTFAELEKWILTWITKVYHQRTHSEIRMSPIQKWEEGIWGTSSCPGTGLKERPADEETLIIDFLPEFERTIQRSGVSIDGLQYYADVLKCWIGSKSDDGKTPRKFLFKRDPRDISFIWFYEPEIKLYFKVPTARQEIPPISLWEYRSVIEHLKSIGKKPSDQHAIYEGIYELRQQAEAASKKTKKVRRQNTRRKLHEQTAVTQNTNTPTSTNFKELAEDSLWNQQIEGYEDIR